MSIIKALNHFIAVLSAILLDALRFVSLGVCSNSAVRAENLFLRRQLALFAERKVTARRADDGTRLVLVLLSRLFAWKDALVLVKPGTMIGGHRKGFRFLWRWKSKRQGRPRISVELQKLITQMVEQNVTWGEERIAKESRHVIPRDQRVVTKSVLGGLHHEYRLERIAA